MVGIQGIEMPSSCKECKFRAGDIVNSKYICTVNSDIDSIDKHKSDRHYLCPLIDLSDDWK